MNPDDSGKVVYEGRLTSKLRPYFKSVYISNNIEITKALNNLNLTIKKGRDL
ncbi:hypothetical protein ACU3L3_07545 [Priestia endophytica]